MEIKINNTVLDTTLENEKYLGEVIDAVKEWLGESNMHIKEIVQDGEHLPMEQTSTWWNKNIEDIDKVAIIALTNFEKYTEDLQVVYQYITMLEKAVNSQNFPLAADLIKDAAIIGETLDYFFPKQNDKGMYSIRLAQLIHDSGINEAKNSPENKKLTEFLAKTAFLLQQRINEITDPVGVLKATAQTLTDLVPEIANVSVLLQTGKDAQALNSIITFVELSEKIVRLYSIIKETQTIDLNAITVDEIPFNTFYRDFNDILKELADAFESSDTVLIGDLLEYEIVPRIDILRKYIALIDHNKE